MQQTFTSFAALADSLRRSDVQKAKNLSRSSSLRVNRKRGTGPAVAR